LARARCTFTRAAQRSTRRRRSFSDVPVLPPRRPTGSAQPST